MRPNLAKNLSPVVTRLKLPADVLSRPTMKESDFAELKKAVDTVAHESKQIEKRVKKLEETQEIILQRLLELIKGTDGIATAILERLEKSSEL